MRWHWGISMLAPDATSRAEGTAIGMHPGLSSWPLAAPASVA